MKRSDDRAVIAQRVYTEIAVRPGRTTKDIAVCLDLPVRMVNEALLALEDDGLLISEDDQERLYVYGDK